MKIFISAAEPSGDQIAAEVMEYLSGNHFIGIGGDHMEKHGLKSIFPMSELSVMGFTQIIPKALSILKRINQTAQFILEENPDVVLTVDAYSFHIRLAKKLREKGFKGKLIQYVPPAVWAWKPSRAKNLSKYYDHVFCIFPFEVDYFKRENLKATFVGHPAIYRLAPKDPNFRMRYQIDEVSPVIMILPGSRKQEITKLLPLYLQVAENISKIYPKAHFILPTFPHFNEEITNLLQKHTLKATVITSTSEKHAAFHESTLAIAASGTVALELATYGVPTLIGYITSSLNYWIAKKLATVKYICSVNILNEKPIIPEFIQNDCTVENLTETALERLKIKNTSLKDELSNSLNTLKCPLPDMKPQEYVAQKISSETL